MKHQYQYPDDVEAAMDQFAADNPNAGWREFQARIRTSYANIDESGRRLV
jgi:hypothetical protein